MDTGIFDKHAPECVNGNKMSICKDKGKADGLIWRCGHRNCCGHSKKTIRTGSFFEGLKASLDDIVLVMYYFLNQSSQQEIVAFTGFESKDDPLDYSSMLPSY